MIRSKFLKVQNLDAKTKELIHVLICDYYVYYKASKQHKYHYAKHIRNYLKLLIQTEVVSIIERTKKH